MAVSAEGYLAERLNQLEAEYEREMEAAAQLHEMVNNQLTTSGETYGDGIVGFDDIPVRPGWSMGVQTFKFPDIVRNRYGELPQRPLDTKFWPTDDNPLVDREGFWLMLVICSNGVMDHDTGQWLTADQIVSLHGDMAEVFRVAPADR